MASQKLKKYLVYYQKVLKEDPSNIEARLRLAAIFREMGRISHAVEEYVSASKLLAKEGLPLEAIAACKAVLELDPTHMEIQYFLARLFAQVPEAAGVTSRIIQPVDEPLFVTTKEPSRSAVEEPELITLARPKSEPARGGIASTSPEAPKLQEQVTRHGIESAAIAEHLMRSHDRDDDEDTMDADDPTGPIAFEDLELAMKTQEISSIQRSKGAARDPNLVATIDLDASDLIFEEIQDHGHTAIRPQESEFFVRANEPTETIELGLFNMGSLGLDDDSSEYEIPEIEEVDLTDDTLDEVSNILEPAFLNIDRAEIPEIPLFSKLSPGTFMEVLREIDLRKIPKGTSILTPNDDNLSLFIIVRGHAKVWRDVAGQHVALATIAPGEFFGEFRLLTGRDSMASVTAGSEMEVLELSEDVINVIAEYDPTIWDILWDFYYQRMLNNLLASSHLFRPLRASERVEIAKKFSLKEIIANEFLLREGEACGDVYLVMSGEVSVERHLADGVVEVLATMREGEFFGVVSALREDPYTANVRSLRDTTLLCLRADEFRHIVETHPAIEESVQALIRKRRALDTAFASGMAPYAKFGFTKS